MLELLSDTDTKDNFVRHIIKKSTDWQWLIDNIESKYNYETCKDWNEYWKLFKNSLPEPVKIFGLILTSIDNQHLNLNIKREDIKQMWYIAEFMNGRETWKNASKKVKIDSLKIILLALYITNLINKSNNCNFEIYWNIFINTNLFQIYDFSLIKDNQAEIMRYIDTIDLQNIDLLKKVLLSNINTVEETYNHTLLREIKDNNISADSFVLNKSMPFNNLPWQENTIINILDIDFLGSKFLPKIKYTVSCPDIGNWNQNTLKLIKTYFGDNNRIVDFIVETAFYLRNRKDEKENRKENKKYVPSFETVDLHLQLLVNAIKYHINTRKIIESTSMELMSCLFKDEAVGKFKKSPKYEYFLNWINDQTDVLLEKNLQEMHFPITDENRLWILESDKRKLKNVEDIDSQVDLDKYLGQKDLVKILNEEEFEKIRKKFRQIINDRKVNIISLSSSFIRYAEFLNKCFNNKKLNRDTINGEIIQIQLIWENDIYPKLIDSMTEIKTESTFSDAEIEDVRKLCSSSPITFSTYLLPTSEYALFEELDLISEFPLQSLVTRMSMDKVFPQEKKKINLKYNKVEEIFKDYIKIIKNKYSGLFLNVMDVDDDLQRIIEGYDNKINLIFLLDKREMYDQIINSCEYALNPYSEKVTLGDVTQFFPILEMKIRQIASYCGISPFKGNSFRGNGVKYNDPSTLLTLIISGIYGDKKDLLSAQGFIFVYLAMYDSNFKNMRNELMHGRNYLQGVELDLAYRCTLLSILIINEYLKKIGK